MLKEGKNQLMRELFLNGVCTNVLLGHSVEGFAINSFNYNEQAQIDFCKRVRNKFNSDYYNNGKEKELPFEVEKIVAFANQVPTAFLTAKGLKIKMTLDIIALYCDSETNLNVSFDNESLGCSWLVRDSKKFYTKTRGVCSGIWTVNDKGIVMPHIVKCVIEHLFP